MWQEWETCIQDSGGETTGKGPLARHRNRSNDKIKLDLNDIVWENVNWINLAQDRISSSCEHRYFYTYTKKKFMVKGKVSLYATKAHKEWRYSSTYSSPSHYIEVKCQFHMAQLFYPSVKNFGCPLNRRMGGPDS
jgi:hypothetical protein